jgi:hypothetical protein
LKLLNTNISIKKKCVPGWLDECERRFKNAKSKQNVKITFLDLLFCFLMVAASNITFPKGNKFNLKA